MTGAFAEGVAVAVLEAREVARAEGLGVVADAVAEAAAGESEGVDAPAGLEGPDAAEERPLEDAADVA